MIPPPSPKSLARATIEGERKRDVDNPGITMLVGLRRLEALSLAAVKNVLTRIQHVIICFEEFEKLFPKSVSIGVPGIIPRRPSLLLFIITLLSLVNL